MTAFVRHWSDIDFDAWIQVSGALRRDDPQLAAEHLRGLLKAESIEPLLLHARDDSPDEKEIVLAADRAVAAFLRAYAPTGQQIHRRYRNLGVALPLGFHPGQF